MNGCLCKYPSTSTMKNFFLRFRSCAMVRRVAVPAAQACSENAKASILDPPEFESRLVAPSNGDQQQHLLKYKRRLRSKTKSTEKPGQLDSSTQATRLITAPLLLATKPEPPKTSEHNQLRVGQRAICKSCSAFAPKMPAEVLKSTFTETLRPSECVSQLRLENTLTSGNQYVRWTEQKP